jgi:hypothetical protein
MTSLILKVRNVTSSEKPYRLDIRDHGPVETDYDFVTSLDADTTIAILATGKVRFLFEERWGLTERAQADGRKGVLKVRWEKEAGHPKEFSLSVVYEDGSRLPFAMLDLGKAVGVVRTEQASWEGPDPLFDAEYAAADRRRKVADLREQADRLEAGA